MPSIAQLSCRGRSFPTVLILFVAFTTPSWAAGPFTQFAGAWKGGGVVTTTDGNQEKIRCKANYGVNAAGDKLNVNMDCASDSYRVNLVSTIIVRDGMVSGSWQETTRQIQGDVTGRVPSLGMLQASLQALGGGLELAAKTNGKRQVITITAQGSDIQSVSIKLRKS